MYTPANDLAVWVNFDIKKGKIDKRLGTTTQSIGHIVQQT
jgi:hypothetical protein